MVTMTVAVMHREVGNVRGTDVASTVETSHEQQEV